MIDEYNGTIGVLIGLILIFLGLITIEIFKYFDNKKKEREVKNMVDSYYSSFKGETGYATPAKEKKKKREISGQQGDRNKEGKESGS